METERDKELWRIAKKRVAFKRHLVIYLVVNLFFWLLWYFTDRNDYESGVLWSIFKMLGWGIALTFNFIKAYLNNSHSAIEKEYNKLKNK